MEECPWPLALHFLAYPWYVAAPLGGGADFIFLKRYVLSVSEAALFCLEKIFKSPSVFFINGPYLPFPRGPHNFVGILPSNVIV